MTNDAASSDAQGTRPAGPDESLSLADRVRRWLASDRPCPPTSSVSASSTGVGYDAASERLARALTSLELTPGECVAVWFPDGRRSPRRLPGHRAGRAPRVGPRCTVRRGRARPPPGVCRVRRSWSPPARWEGGPARDMIARLRTRGVEVRHHIVVDGDGFPDDPIEIDASPWRETPGESVAGRGLSPDQIFLYNSTSGTTGLPKIVIHDQLRWFAFHRMAVDVGHFTSDDVFMSAVPAPFGFGLWTSHVTPGMLGVPTVVMPPLRRPRRRSRRSRDIESRCSPRSRPSSS